MAAIVHHHSPSMVFESVKTVEQVSPKLWRADGDRDTTLSNAIMAKESLQLRDMHWVNVTKRVLHIWLQVDFDQLSIHLWVVSEWGGFECCQDRVQCSRRPRVCCSVLGLQERRTAEESFACNTDHCLTVPCFGSSNVQLWRRVQHLNCHVNLGLVRVGLYPQPHNTLWIVTRSRPLLRPREQLCISIWRVHAAAFVHSLNVAVTTLAPFTSTFRDHAKKI